MSTQSPSALADAAVANTGIRILHRMESSADRTLMLDDLDANEQTRQITARLNKGEAVVRWPERDEIELVYVQPESDVDSGRQVSDQMVSERMSDHRNDARHLLPYALCSPEICTTGCQSRVRRIGSQLAEKVGVQAGEIWRNEGEKLQPIAGLLSKEAAGDLQHAYCGAVHLSVNGDAFLVSPGIDDRPPLAQALRRGAADDH